MDKVWEWLPWVLVMMLCGSINVIVAYQKFYERARSPFFKPWRFLGFYIWLLIEMGLPAIFFWFYGKVSTKPAITPEFCISAISTGFFFMLFVNSNSDLGFVSFSIDKFYGEMQRLVDNRIAASQTTKITRFKQELKQYLAQNPIVIDAALDYLKIYVESDIAQKRDEQKRNDLLQKIQSAQPQTNLLARIEATSGIAEQVLRPNDYPDWLKSIRAPQPLLNSLKSR
jgi:hypothetical protein